jgi:CBS domain-containing protein
MTGLLSDATGVWGRSMGAGDELRSQAVDAARRHPASRRAMLQDATSVRATIPSRLRVFATHDDSVDLKVAAVDPLVKIARWAGLSAGSNAVSTLERLHDAAAAKVLENDDASMLGDCYLSLSRIRWRVRAAAWVNGGRVTERVSLAELPPLERAALRTVARELAGLRLKLDFLASTSSFS